MQTPTVDHAHVKESWERLCDQHEFEKAKFRQMFGEFLDNADAAPKPASQYGLFSQAIRQAAVA